MSKTIQPGSLTHVPLPTPQPAGNGLARQGDFAQMISPSADADLPIGASHARGTRDSSLIASPSQAGSGSVAPIFAAPNDVRVVAHLPKSQPTETVFDERSALARCPEMPAGEAQSILLSIAVSSQHSSRPYGSDGNDWGAPAVTSEQTSFADCGPGDSRVSSPFISDGESRSAYPVLRVPAQNGCVNEMPGTTAAMDPAVLVSSPTGEVAPGLPAVPDLVAVWSRIYPEHWLANGYLSVVDVSVREIRSSEQTLAVAPGRGGIEVVVSGAQTGQELTAETQLAVNASSTWAHIPHLQEDGEPESGDSMVESGSHSLGLALADHVWAEQLLRVSRDRDGVSTVWLRDYALDTSAIDPLIETLRRHAIREGWVLGRIVVNGHEVWRAALGGRKSDGS